MKKQQQPAETKPKQQPVKAAQKKQPTTASNNPQQTQTTSKQQANNNALSQNSDPNRPKSVKKPVPLGPVRMPQIASNNIVRGGGTTNNKNNNGFGQAQKRVVSRQGSGNSAKQGPRVVRTSNQGFVQRPKSPDISYRPDHEDTKKFPGQKKKLFQ